MNLQPTSDQSKGAVQDRHKAIRGLLAKGYSKRQTARILGVDRSLIYYVIRKGGGCK